MNRKSCLLISPMAFLLACWISFQPFPASGQVALYDNADSELVIGERLGNPPALELLAQPFRTGERHTTITSISIPMGIVGAPTGNVPISIWDDHEGMPGHSIAEVGVIEDVSSLPVVDLETSPTVLEPVSFDTTIAGLAPDSTYYVVINHRNGNWSNPFEGNLIVGGLLSDAGTNGAGSMVAFAPDDFGQQWFDLSLPLGEPRYLPMRVIAVPEPSSIALLLLAIGSLALTWRNRRSRVA